MRLPAVALACMIVFDVFVKKKIPKENSDFWNSEYGGQVRGHAAAKRVPLMNR